jgi:hypothetical protein
VEERVFEFVPPELQAWARKVGIPDNVSDSMDLLAAKGIA